MSDAMRLLKGKRIYWHGKEPYRDWNGLCLRVSVFDHYLNEEEAETALMSYDLAHKNGVEAEYMDGERKWISFYRYLSRCGATIGGVDGLRLVHLRSDSRRLCRIVIDSLRERRLMNVLFNAEPVRVLGGHDRTDVLLPPTTDIREQLEMIAREHGLHPLN